MSSPPRRLVSLALALALGLTAALAAPAVADEGVDQAIAGLDALTSRIERLTGRAHRWIDTTWDFEVAEALDTAVLNRIERSLASARVESVAVLDPLIGPASTGAVAAAITAAFYDEAMPNQTQIELTTTLAAWERFRAAVDEARGLRDALRERLGLPPVTGVRVCPLESVDALLQDWGDPRGWRSHKGTDINADQGTRIVAMERGVIIQMGWHYLGGNQVYLLGEVTGDVYYYAHLDSYADGLDVGLPVLAGQLVGHVGNTGNADIPHLHLGWMPAAGGVDLSLLDDPYPMLVELCY